jgi:hypothetical protein
MLLIGRLNLKLVWKTSLDKMKIVKVTFKNKEHFYSIDKIRIIIIAQ